MELTLLPTAASSTVLPSSSLPAMAVPPVFVDISSALSFSDSQRLLAGWLKQNPARTLETSQVALDCGSLVLTGKMLSKLLETLRQQGLSVTMVYARLSQTQQAALSCGLGVKEYPPASEVALSSDGFAASSVVLSSATAVSEAGPLASEKAEKFSELLTSVSTESVVPAFQVEQPSEDLLPQHTSTSIIFNPKNQTESVPLASEEPMPLVSLGGDEPKSLSERKTFVEPAVATPIRVSSLIEPMQPTMLQAPSVTHYQATAADTLVPVPITGAEAMPTRLVTGTLRSGQTVVSEGHLLVMGDVHNGSEIIARGHIVVWGELRGVAHAGAPLKEGDAPQQWASIRALLLRAVQLRIGSTIARRPDRTSNHKPESPVERVWQPEFARMVDGEIRIQADLNPGHSIDFT